jgi:hypothetical protein
VAPPPAQEKALVRPDRRARTRAARHRFVVAAVEDQPVASVLGFLEHLSGAGARTPDLEVPQYLAVYLEATPDSEATLGVAAEPDLAATRGSGEMRGFGTRHELRSTPNLAAQKETEQTQDLSAQQDLGTAAERTAVSTVEPQAVLSMRDLQRVAVRSAVVRDEVSCPRRAALQIRIRRGPPRSQVLPSHER